MLAAIGGAVQVEAVVSLLLRIHSAFDCGAIGRVCWVCSLEWTRVIPANIVDDETIGLLIVRVVNLKGQMWMGMQSALLIVIGC